MASLLYQAFSELGEYYPVPLRNDLTRTNVFNGGEERRGIETLLPRVIIVM
jgi:hypothetical protein